MQEEQYIHIDKDGVKRYYADREMTILHRTDGPAVEYTDGDKEWWNDGQRHRVGGPAIEYSNGNKQWWLNNKLHCLDGPAIKYTDGTAVWWRDGQLHRTDGPAVEWAAGAKEWYLNGVQYTEEQFEKIMHPQALELTLDQIAAKFNIDVKNLKIIK